MASSVHKYLDFLEQKVPIAPANSQEELQAAQTIAGVMKRHDVEVDIEEFDASSAAPFMRGILQIILLVGVLIAGIGILPLTIVFGVLAVASGVILALDFMGNDLLTRYSPHVVKMSLRAIRLPAHLFLKETVPLLLLHTTTRLAKTSSSPQSLPPSTHI